MYTKKAMGCGMKKRDNRMVNGLMNLMPTQFHSRGKYMPGSEKYQKRNNHQEALLREVEAAVARAEDLNP